MPSGAELSHVSDGITFRSGIGLGDGGSSGARVYITAPTTIYVMSVDGAIYSARATLPGLRDIHSPSASDCLQQCIDNLGTIGGTITLLRGTYAWTAPVLLPRSLQWPLRIVGESQAVVIQLSSAGRRVFDFNKIADHDNFQRMEFANLSVDAAALSSADTSGNKGKNPVFLGAYADGVFMQHVNLKRLAFKDLWVYNVPVEWGAAPTQNRFHLYLVQSHATTGEGTTNTTEDITVERCRFEGGSNGVIVGTHIITGDSGGSGVNATCQRITIRDCFLDPGQTPSAFTPFDNIQVGVSAHTQDVLIENCEAWHAGDLGYEVNSGSNTIIDGCRAHNAWSGGFFLQEFNTPGLGTTGGETIIHNCLFEQSELPSAGSGVNITATQAINHGMVTVTDFQYHSNVANPTTGTSAIRINNAIARRVKIDGLHCEWVGLATTGSQTLIGVDAPGFNQNTNIGIRNIEVNASGSVSSGTLSLIGVRAYMTSAANTIKLDIADVAFAESITSMTAGGSKAIVIGDPGQASRFTMPTIRGLRMLSTADTAPIGIVINGTGSTTINDMRIENCDFSSAVAGVTEISYAGTSNAANVGVYGINWKTAPVSGAWPSLAASTVANTNAFGYPVLVSILTNGAGTITNVSVGTPGGSFQTIAGAGSLTVPTTFVLSPGHQFKMTYATTTPTVVYIPILT